MRFFLQVIVNLIIKFLIKIFFSIIIITSTLIAITKNSHVSKCFDKENKWMYLHTHKIAICSPSLPKVHNYQEIVHWTRNIINCQTCEDGEDIHKRKSK